MVEENALNLVVLYDLALSWCPKGARWAHLLESPNSWGAAHELGHALLEPPWRWKFGNYDRCALAFCHCPNAVCDSYEMAAMRISRGLLLAAKQGFMSDLEVAETSDYDLIDPVHEKRSLTLLRRKKLWPVPRTRRSLEAALVRRLRKPRGGPLSRSEKKARVFDPYAQLASELMQGLA